MSCPFQSKVVGVHPLLALGATAFTLLGLRGALDYGQKCNLKEASPAWLLCTTCACSYSAHVYSHTQKRHVSNGGLHDECEHPVPWTLDIRVDVD